MPDIDDDLRSDIKDVVVMYLKKRYGDRAISQILTKSYLQGRSAIDKVAMILGARDTQLVQEYGLDAVKWKIGRKEKLVRVPLSDDRYRYDPDELEKLKERKATLIASGWKVKGDNFERIQYSYDYRGIAEKLKKKDGVDIDGKTLAKNKDALMKGLTSDIEKELVEAAIIMDANLDHTGLHAAGVVIADNDDLSKTIPVAWDKGAETWKTQCDMIQLEGLHGLLKMDLLLLTTLDIITYTLREVEKTHPEVDIDIQNLPIEEDVIKKIYGTGDTKAVFQFESSGMRSFMKRLQPNSMEDIIAGVSLYRPGPMDYIPQFIEGKNSDNILYDCPQLESILKNTYGVIVYQEQVMQIVQSLAGYSLGRADIMRRAISKKHLSDLIPERYFFIYGNKNINIEGVEKAVAELNEVYEKEAKEGNKKVETVEGFIKRIEDTRISQDIYGCIGAGISEETANRIFDKMVAFASYAFNKSHAAAYSLTSYMTAWLKYYYPVEFYVANLNYVKAQKEIPSLIADAKMHGIKILPPDVNKSFENFSVEDGAIRYGLASLKGAKSRADAVVSNREGGYRDFKSFVAVKPGQALVDACVYSGACDSLTKDGANARNSMLDAYADLSKLYDKICANRVKIEELEKDDSKAAASKLELAKLQLEDLEHEWAAYEIKHVDAMKATERLDKELEYTSVYFSGNPLDGYVIPDKDLRKDIAELEDQESCWIVGAMSEESILKTKANAQNMMVGKLSDYTDTVRFIIFPKTYQQIESKLQKVMVFKGRFTAATEDEEAQFIVSDVKTLSEKQNLRINIHVKQFDAAYKYFTELGGDPNTGMQVYLTSDGVEMTRVNGAFITEEFAKSKKLNYRILK